MSVWESTPEKEKSGGKAVVFVLLGLIALVAVAYAGLYFNAGDKVPHGTTVSGVPIGGHTEVEAAEVLEDGLAERIGRRIEVSVDDTTQRVSPAEVGLSVDYAESVDAGGGSRSWSPRRLWNYYTSGESLQAVVDVDTSAFETFVAGLDKSAGTKPREGRVGFKGDKIVTVEPRVGKAVDAEQARGALLAAYLSETPGIVEIQLVRTQPEIDEADVAAASKEFANPAVSGPVTLRFGKASITLQPAQFTPALSLVAADGVLEPKVDKRKLHDVIKTGVSDGDPVDASVELVNGKPQVIPSKPGVTYDKPGVNKGFLDLVSKPVGERELKVEAKVAQADFTTEDAHALGIEEQVSTFSTYYPHSDYRNTNIGRAAKIINGTVLKPGETFSLNGVLGERTRENGFTEGFVINNGIYKQEVGGGISQMATTTFNAMFFAGLEDIEHKAHSLYISRYPVGREATVSWGSIDLQFRNDTPYGVLVEAHVTPSTSSSSGVVTVSMHSTDYWDITTTTGERYNHTEPKTRTLHDEECYPNEGYGGFDINVVRYFRKAGSSTLDHSETFFTRYNASDTVICKPPPEEED